MKKWSFGKTINWEKASLIVLLIFCLVFCFILVRNLLSKSEPEEVEVQQKTSSDLISTKEIADLSVSEFVYNGIAQTYKENGEHDYNIIYKSTVKVSVEADDIKFNVDEEEKVVTFYIPEFRVGNPMIDVNAISTIPTRNDLYMDDLIKICRNDALLKAKESEKLITSAKENMQSIVEAWFSPVLEGYSFEYSFGSAEGGEVI